MHKKGVSVAGEWDGAMGVVKSLNLRIYMYENLDQFLKGEEKENGRN